MKVGCVATETSFRFLTFHVFVFASCAFKIIVSILVASGFHNSHKKCLLINGLLNLPV